jgi:hypothetical protein
MSDVMSDVSPTSRAETKPVTTKVVTVRFGATFALVVDAAGAEVLRFTFTFPGVIHPPRAIRLRVARVE